ncbi:MAG TPA: hypothetical protein VJ966_03460 [Actinomycetes bacterium]|nr:hypothetical protein [Actinomycetes bacterium]
MLKSIIGWILATASALLGLLVFIFVVSVLPLGPLAAGAGEILKGVGWLFGTFLPGAGQLALDAARDRLSDGGTAPTTTTIP